jgi:hypothetical protein
VGEAPVMAYGARGDVSVALGWSAAGTWWATVVSLTR